MESCPQMLGIAVESLVISAAVVIQMRGSGVAGLVGRASAGRGFQILRAEETELGEGPLQGGKVITFKFFKDKYLCAQVSLQGMLIIVFFVTVKS